MQRIVPLHSYNEGKLALGSVIQPGIQGLNQNFLASLFLNVRRIFIFQMPRFQCLETDERPWLFSYQFAYFACAKIEVEIFGNPGMA